MKINISPVSVWNSNGVVSASKFEVVTVTYEAPSSGGVVRASAGNAECRIWTSDDKLVASRLVSFTEAQADGWDDDGAFFRVIAQNAGLTPV